ncbi:MAG: DinB family protein, partial [Planctomycetota bacterium]|nr:DinB family protein [Planctomycetota bacterium]
KAFVKDAYGSACDRIASLSVEQLESALPEGPILGGLPRKQVVNGIVDHTAHHRGALSVYVRHAGATPAMPYAEV